MISLEILNCGSSAKALLVERTLIKDCSIRIFFQCIDVSDTPQFNAYWSIYKNDLKMIGENFKSIVYILNNAHCPYQLTEKQKICLFLLLRGKTTKQIASILGRSARTIDSHLDVLKNKMNCRYKSELIEKSIDAGLFYFLPKSTLLTFPHVTGLEI